MTHLPLSGASASPFFPVAVLTSPALSAGPATARKDVGSAVSDSPVTDGHPSSAKEAKAARASRLGPTPALTLVARPDELPEDKPCRPWSVDGAEVGLRQESRASSDRREVARKDHARQVLRVDAALAAWTDDAPESLCSRCGLRAVERDGKCASCFDLIADDVKGERHGC